MKICFTLKCSLPLVASATETSRLRSFYFSFVPMFLSFLIGSPGCPWSTSFFSGIQAQHFQLMLDVNTPLIFFFSWPTRGKVWAANSVSQWVFTWAAVNHANYNWVSPSILQKVSLISQVPAGDCNLLLCLHTRKKNWVENQEPHNEVHNKLLK